MPSAIFIVPITDSGPTLDLELIQDGTPGYGYSVIGQVPQAGTCLVRVWASEEALDTLAASEDVEFVEDVEDVTDVQVQPLGIEEHIIDWSQVGEVILGGSGNGEN